MGGFLPPTSAGIAAFLRQKLAPGLPWAFIRAAFGTGSGLYFGPKAAVTIEESLQNVGCDVPSRMTIVAGSLFTGAIASVATQGAHNVTLVAGRMAALGETK